MSRPTSPPPTTYNDVPAWLASAGGMTVLVAAALWVPRVVTVALGLIVIALSLVVCYRATIRAGAGGGHGLAGLVTAGLGLLLVGLLTIPGIVPDDGGLPGVAWSTPAEADEASPDDLQPSPLPEPTTSPNPEPGLLRPDAVEASGTAEPSTDGAGETVTFEAGNLVDGQADSAWRVAGDGIGHTLSFHFDRPVHLTAIALLPGYAKVDPVDGTDRFSQNRRVSSASYTFDDASSVAVTFSDRAGLQQVEVDADTTSVVIQITGTTSPGDRDYTAISEVQFTGWTTG